MLILAMLLTAACSGGGAAEPPPKSGGEEAIAVDVLYTLKVDVYPEEGGLVYPAEAEVPAGEMFEVEAIPVPGYEFEGWSGADTSASPNLILTIDGDKQLTAHFLLSHSYTFSADVYPEEGGSVNPSEAEVTDGDLILVEAIPNSGYVFEGWTGSVTSSQANIKIIMDGDKDVTANFVLASEPSTSHKDPADISLDDIGESYLVCGKVTNFGGACDFSKGKHDRAYSFIKLDKEFLIVSTEWFFEAGWKGAGLCLEDTVDPFAGNAVFIFDKEEGEAGSDCFSGEKTYLYREWHSVTETLYQCPAGSYFQPCSHCEEAHFNLPSLDLRRPASEDCW
jgi:uncharacterized repeat protein (TIGR02543 family)